MFEHTETVARQSAFGEQAGSGAQADPYVRREPTRLPKSGMALDLERTALVVIDPQVGFLRRSSVAWPALSERAAEHTAVRNMGRLFEASKRAGITAAIALTLGGFRGTASGFLPDLKRYIEDGSTIICESHTLSILRVNDLGVQLRKRRVSQVVLSGMIATLPMEAHLRDFLEQGFEIAVVRDALAGPRLPEGNGYLSALVNFRCIANALWTTDETIKKFA